MKAAQAEGDFAEAIKLAPKNAYLYFNRANMFADQKNFDRAVSDYTYTIQLDPRLAEAYYNRGIVFYRMGKYDAAQQDLSKAGELGLYDAYALSKKIKGKKD